MSHFLTVNEAKFDLKIENDDEDTDVASKIAMAEATIRAYVRRPLTLELYQRVFEAPHILGYLAIRQLSLPIYPIADAGDSAGDFSSNQGVEILDADLDAVSTSDYRVEKHTGLVVARNSFHFYDFPYTITWIAGLGARDDYTTYVIPLVRMALLDTLRDFYFARNPRAQTESSGGGVATNYFNDGLPKRVQAALEPLRMKRLV